MGKKNRRRADSPAPYELLRAALKSRGLSRGPWHGSAADDVIGPIADSVEDVLRAQLSRYDPLEVVGWAASNLAVSQDAQYESRIRTVEVPELVLDTNFHTENAMAANVVLELAIRGEGQVGSAELEIEGARTLALLGHQLWRWRLTADRVAHGLVQVNWAKLQHDGTFDVFVADRPPFRFSRHAAQYLGRMAASGRGAEDAEIAQGLVASLQAGQPLPADLRGVDAALREGRGYGLVACYAALSLLERAAGGNDGDAAGYRATRPQLLELAAANIPAWYPDVDLREVENALAWLTRTQESVQGTPVPIAEYRAAETRPLSRPVVELPDGSLFVPRTAAGYCMFVLILRVLEGTWPEKLPDPQGSLGRALELRRREHRPIDGFERDLDRTLELTGLPYLTSLTTTGGRPSPVGVPITLEIDALVVQPEQRVIWVIEAKDLAIPFSAKAIRGELRKYYRPGGHRDKLRKKCAEIAVAPDTVATRLGAPSTGGYQVGGLFVTREPTPAACYDQQEFAFLTLDALPLFLAKVRP